MDNHYINGDRSWITQTNLTNTARIKYLSGDFSLDLSSKIKFLSAGFSFRKDLELSSAEIWSNDFRKQSHWQREIFVFRFINFPLINGFGTSVATSMWTWGFEHCEEIIEASSEAWYLGWQRWQRSHKGCERLVDLNHIYSNDGFGRGHSRGAPFCEANDTVISGHMCPGFSVLALAGDTLGRPCIGTKFLGCGGGGGRALRTRHRSIFFIFMQFFWVEIVQNNRLTSPSLGSTPPLGNPGCATLFISECNTCGSPYPPTALFTKTPDAFCRLQECPSEDVPPFTARGIFPSTGIAPVEATKPLTFWIQVGHG